MIYLVFNAGYSAGSGEQLVRDDLCAEAIRLARLMAGLMDDPEVRGLLALLLLQHARRDARTDEAGDLVLLPAQDRTRWDHALIAEGHDLVRDCLRTARPGPYQVQAAIAAVHTDAGPAGPTDWRQIVQLYDHLMALTPGPVVALNRAVAVAELDGPLVALRLVDRLDLPRYGAFHAVRADLLRRLDRPADAAAEYRTAAGLAGNEAERRFLAARAREIAGPGVDTGA